MQKLWICLLLGLLAIQCSKKDQTVVAANPNALLNIEFAALSAEGNEEAAPYIPRFEAFKTELMKNLTEAIQNDGTAAAIERCKIVSPEMEKKHSDKARIYRISDRPRNPNHSPNEFEAAVLKLWKARLDSGEKIGPVAFKTASDFYVVAPIVLKADLCLQCHGKNINTEVQSKLAELYPEDRATGYSMRELRGAFVARKSLND
ncbi:MAG: DUF3365 domain-containing protein [Leptospiraceae bacterium]|nr:DUF3365 domain-containing protein [Leptospiraceae bacterium]